jgi:tetratricopeptide (TPR) repeat protein
MSFANGDSDLATSYWNKSLEQQPSAWAYRNLAVLKQIAGDHNEVLRLYRRAIELLPHLRPLAIEYLEILLLVDRPGEALSALHTLPTQIQNDSRVKVLEGTAALRLGRTESCQQIFSDSFELVDIREGESTLTELWMEFQSRKQDPTNGHATAVTTINAARVDTPLPRLLDFRVVPEPHLAGGVSRRGLCPEPFVGPGSV